MNIEELKLVIEMVKEISGDAQAVAIVWLLLDKLLPLMGWLVAGFGAFKLLMQLILNLNSHSDMCDIRTLLYPGTSGDLSRSERTLVLKKIEEISRKQPRGDL